MCCEIHLSFWALGASRVRQVKKSSKLQEWYSVAAYVTRWKIQPRPIGCDDCEMAVNRTTARTYWLTNQRIACCCVSLRNFKV